MKSLNYTRQQLTDKYGEGSHFGEIISSLESELWKDGSIICEVYIDDNFISENQERELHGRKLEEITELKVVTRKQDELIAVTIDSVVKAAPEITEKSKSFSERLRNEGITNNIDGFIEFMEGCQWFSESLFLLRPLVFKKIEDDVFQTDWGKAEEFFALVAQEALNAFEKKDYTMLSDILEYDLTSSLDKWVNLLTESEEIKAIKTL